MFAVGDIVKIFAPVAGHDKYHLCVLVGIDGAAHQFLFLNSEAAGFAGCYEVSCARVPCLPPSDTGKTVFSFTMVPRYTDAQLKLHKAAKMGVLEKALAQELLEFAKTALALTDAEKKTVLAALKMLCGP